MLLPEAALNEPSLAGGLLNRETRPSAILARLLPPSKKPSLPSHPPPSGALLTKCLLFAPQLEMQPPLPMLSSYSGMAGFTPLPKEIQQLVFREEGTEAMRRSVRCAFPAREVI